MAVPDTFNRSLWAATAPPAPTLPSLSGLEEAEVAIVGAGFLGLSLALHLAEAGIPVVLLEAEEPGFGASGRNTGFVVPSLKPKFGPEDLRKRFGEARGVRLARLVGESGDFLFGMVQRLGITCEAEPTGWFQPASTEAGEALLRARVPQWQALGRPVTLLNSETTRDALGFPGYRCALFDPTGGQINPLAYARGLARAALERGARVYARARVEALAREKDRWLLKTVAGQVVARSVYLTTNALLGLLRPEVHRSLLQVRTYQVATQPLSAALQSRILPGRQPLADLRNHTFAVRWSADGRLVGGGLAVLNNAGAVDRMAPYFLRRFRHYIPGLPTLEPAYSWSGTVAVTGDFLPRLFQAGPDLFAPIGCNGRGVALTTALGAALARFVVTRDAEALPVPLTAPAPRPFHALMNFGPSIWLPWSRLKDARAEWHAAEA